MKHRDRLVEKSNEGIGRTEYIVKIHCDIKLDSNKNHSELNNLVTRWTSRNLKDGYLRFNSGSTLTKNDLETSISKILDIPFLWRSSKIFELFIITRFIFVKNLTQNLMRKGFSYE